MKRVKFIYNPKSGDKKIVNKLDYIIKVYQENGYILEIHRIMEEYNIESAFKDNIKDIDHILISGGDGTIDSVVNVMMKLDIKLPIGVLPSGTANDFAHILGIDNNICNTLEKIISKKSKFIDVGKINNTYFINVASAGMFTDVSQKISNELKNSLGKVAYYIKGIEEAVNMRSFNISVKSEELNYSGPIYLILIFNGKTAGNLNLAYKAEIDDGLLDVIIFKEIPIVHGLNMLIKVIKQEHLDENEVIYFRTKKLEVICEDNILVDIDGERGPDFPLTVECIDRRLEILGIE